MKKAYIIRSVILPLALSLGMIFISGCTEQNADITAGSGGSTAPAGNVENDDLQKGTPLSSSWKPVQYDTSEDGFALSKREIMTADKRHCIVCSTDDGLGYTDAEGKYTRISDNFIRPSHVRNKGFVYTDENLDYHICRFEDNFDRNIGKIDSIGVSRENFVVSYIKGSGIYLLEPEASEPELLGTTMYDSDIMFVGDKDKTVFWQKHIKHDTTVYMYSNGRKSEIYTFAKSSNVYIDVSAGQDYAVVYDGKEIIVVNGFDQYENAGIKFSSYGTIIYTEDGLIEDDSSEKFRGIYFSCREDGGRKLCYLDEKLNVTGMIENCERNFKIAGGYLYYFEKETSGLLCAKLDHGSVVSSERVIEKVDLIDWEQPGNNIFFMADVVEMNTQSGDGTVYYPDSDNISDLLLDIDLNNAVEEDRQKEWKGTLYAYNPESGLVKVASDVLCGKRYQMYSGRAGGYYMATLDLKVSVTGRTVEFFKASKDGKHRDKYTYSVGGKAELTERGAE